MLRAYTNDERVTSRRALRLAPLVSGRSGQAPLSPPERSRPCGGPGAPRARGWSGPTGGGGGPSFGNSRLRAASLRAGSSHDPLKGLLRRKQTPAELLVHRILGDGHLEGNLQGTLSVARGFRHVLRDVVEIVRRHLGLVADDALESPEQ